MSDARTTPGPRVSLIVPVKDTPPALLHAAIRSAREQDCTEALEIVLWDDGSTDPGTARMIEELRRLGTRRRRIRVGGTAANRGISAARNAACRLATGTWYLWLDSDDELPRGAVRSLLERVDDRVLFVLGQCLVERPGQKAVLHRNDVFLRHWRENRRVDTDPLLSAVFAVHGGLVRRDLFWRVHGFDELMPYAELTDWFLRVMSVMQPSEVEVVSDPTYRYFKRAGSHSADRVELERYRVEVLRRYGMSFDRRTTARFDRHCIETGARLYDVMSDTGTKVPPVCVAPSCP